MGRPALVCPQCGREKPRNTPMMGNAEWVVEGADEVSESIRGWIRKRLRPSSRRTE